MLSLRPLLFLLAFTACAASQRDSEPWRLELETSGGITGRGLGAMTVESGGKATVQNMQRKSCEVTAAVEELHAAIAASKPEAWAESYVPEDPCCDRIEYVLTLNGRTTKWIDDPKKRPADLERVGDAARKLLSDLAAECR